MRGASTKDTTKLNASVPKSSAITAKLTTKFCQETAQNSKEKQKCIQIQRIEPIPRPHVIRKLLRLNPNAMKNTSKPTRSKYQSRSEQESQCDSSSEDTNMTLKFYENFGNEEDNSSTVPTYGHGYYTKEKLKKKGSPLPPPLTVGGV